MNHIKTAKFEKGEPTGKALAYPCKKYEGMYYFNAETDSWERVLKVNKETLSWKMQPVDIDGNALGVIRTHCFPMWADRFADFPFDMHAAQQLELELVVVEDSKKLTCHKACHQNKFRRTTAKPSDSIH